MVRKRLLAAGTAALVAGLGLLLSPSAAQARPRCDVNDPPPICLPTPIQRPPTGTATFNEGDGMFYGGKIGSVWVSGHADDPDGGPVTVDITVDGVVKATVVADDPWWQTGLADGYQVFANLPVGTPTVCAVARDYGGDSDTSLGCYVAHAPVGELEGLSSGLTATVTGWVIDPDTTDPVQILVDAMSPTGQHTYAYYTADLYRADTLDAPASYGRNHGFSVTYTRPAGTCLLISAVNVGPGAGSPIWEDCLQ